MVFTSVRLQNYRSYQDSAFEFSSNVNIIVGPNASGKTNLLDALHLCANGTSIKPSRERMVRLGASWARIDTLTSTNQIRAVKLPENDLSLQLEIDKKPYRRLPLSLRVPIILFEPSQLYLITSSPDMRRTLMDDMLEKLIPAFSKQKNNYLKVLRQRNALLKQPIDRVKQQVFAWDVRLSELAGGIVEERLKLLDDINNSASTIYSDIAQRKHMIKFSYDSKVATSTYASSLLNLLQASLENDHRRGFTGYGPHRDDIRITIDQDDMREVASRGETRSILLTIKIIEGNLLESVYNQKPLLLLDDVFGELDGLRRKRLIEFISDNQVFITTTDADIIGHDFAQQASVISVNTS